MNFGSAEGRISICIGESLVPETEEAPAPSRRMAASLSPWRGKGAFVLGLGSFDAGRPLLR
jgi:hypothetical protein